MFPGDFDIRNLRDSLILHGKNNPIRKFGCLF